MIIPFNSPIYFSQVPSPLLWQLAENYLNIGQKAYEVTRIEGKVVCLERTTKKSNLFSTVIKITSYLTIVFPLLALTVKKFYRKSHQFTVTKLDDIISELRRVQVNGMKLALFVGRGPQQTVPQESGWIWCSLDLEKKTVVSTRLHLEMNFNDTATMAKIQGLFDKVVSDYSVIKFISSPWKTLYNLLVSKPHAELIAESWTGIKYIREPLTFYPESGSLQVPISSLISDRQNLVVKELLQQIRACLLNRFEEVNLVHGTYPHREGSRSFETDYWVARRPKIPKMEI